MEEAVSIAVLIASLTDSVAWASGVGVGQSCPMLLPVADICLLKAEPVYDYSGNVS